MAVKVLSDRFGHRDMLVDDHLDHLLSLEPVRSSSEVSKLRILHDEVTFRMNALDGLGVSPGEYGAVLRRVLLKALPSDFCILYRQRQKEALPRDNAAASPADQAELVKDLMNFIRVQIEIREESGFGEPTSFTSKRHAQRDFRGPELLTFGGLLKMVQISCSIPSLVLVTWLSFNHNTGEFEMEHTDVSLTMTIFAFATSAAIITVTILNGSVDVPHMQMYRMNYAIGTLALAVNTVLFYVRFTNASTSATTPCQTEHEPDSSPSSDILVTNVEHEDMSIPFDLCVANTVAYGPNYLYAFMLRAPAPMADTVS
ncbi:hypothetical protein HPB50_000289 [Hyalomma asiaticum]|uniref:Uncharacterized protein n=1 Tax=Hyalomma asiaticum TaxID=266040 RepID=A0ACB7RQ26_HYAAI|nr:hypothetical protein HPB50_000289 [Hyalomma asiaticum]